MEALHRHRTGMPIVLSGATSKARGEVERLNSPVIRKEDCAGERGKTPQVVSDGQARYRDQSDVRWFERKLGGTAEEFLRP